MDGVKQASVTLFKTIEIEVKTIAIGIKMEFNLKYSKDSWGYILNGHMRESLTFHH